MIYTPRNRQQIPTAGELKISDRPHQAACSTAVMSLLGVRTDVGAGDDCRAPAAAPSRRRRLCAIEGHNTRLCAFTVTGRLPIAPVLPRSVTDEFAWWISSARSVNPKQTYIQLASFGCKKLGGAIIRVSTIVLWALHLSGRRVSRETAFHVKRLPIGLWVVSSKLSAPVGRSYWTDLLGSGIPSPGGQTTGLGTEYERA